MHCTTCNVNLCVLGYPLFHSDDNIVNMEEYISTKYKGLKARKIAKFCTFLWYDILRISYTSILVTMGSILPQVFLTLNIKLNFLLINRLCMSNIIVIRKNIFIRKMSGNFKLVCKMVTLVIIVPTANSYSQ